MPFCPKCGKEVKEGAAFCSNCGEALVDSVARQPTPPPRRVPERMLRPMGIAILAILEVLVGVISLIFGILIVVLAGWIGLTGVFPVLLGGLFGVIGGILIIVGIFSFVIAYGLWNGYGWAWTIGLVFAILWIIMGLISLPGGIVPILLNAFIIYYLTRPHVKNFFGKEAVTFTI